MFYSDYFQFLLRSLRNINDRGRFLLLNWHLHHIFEFQAFLTVLCKILFHSCSVRSGPFVINRMMQFFQSRHFGKIIILVFMPLLLSPILHQFRKILLFLAFEVFFSADSTRISVLQSRLLKSNGLEPCFTLSTQNVTFFGFDNFMLGFFMYHLTGPNFNNLLLWLLHGFGRWYF